MKSQGGDEIITNELLNKLGYSKQQNSSKEDFTLIVPFGIIKTYIKVGYLNQMADHKPKAI